MKRARKGKEREKGKWNVILGLFGEGNVGEECEGLETERNEMRGRKGREREKVWDEMEFRGKFVSLALGG